MGYYTGTAANADDIVLAIQNAATDSGWTLDRQAALGTGNAEGRETLLHKGDIYVQLRSMVSTLGAWTSRQLWQRGPAVFVTGATGYNSGAAWNAQPGTSWVNPNTSDQAVLIGPAPTAATGTAWAHLSFPCPYRIFTFSDPDVVLMIVRATATVYQWIMFGRIEKFGTWTGGQFVAASNNGGQAGSGGNYPSSPIYSPSGNNRGRSYAPFHDMSTGYNPGQTPENGVNSQVYMDIPGDTGASATYKWTWNSRQNPYSSSVFYRAVLGANSLSDPVNSRSPNAFNQVAAMSPFMLMSQRDSEPNWTIIGRLAHVRQIPIDNFNPEDTFSLGPDKWIVFPYFEKGGVTGRYGWAVNANEIP